MCDPGSLIAIAGSLLAPLLAPKPPAPPKPIVPAAPAPTARAPGATVQLGVGTGKSTTAVQGDKELIFAPTRKAGTSLGGLGRSSLAL